MPDSPFVNLLVRQYRVLAVSLVLMAARLAILSRPSIPLVLVYRHALVVLDSVLSSLGKFSHNAFGLQDMHGNVWEWSADCWHCDYSGAPANGQAWSNAHTSAMRTVRGGGWLDKPNKIRSASRSGYLETALPQHA